MMKSLTEFMLSADSEENVDWDGFEVIENTKNSLVLSSPNGRQFIFTKESSNINIAITNNGITNIFKVPLEVYKLIHRKIKP